MVITHLYEQQMLVGKCSGTRVLSAQFAQQHRSTWHAFCGTSCCSDWFTVITHLYEQVLVNINTVAQGCYQLGLHSSTDQHGIHFAMNPNAVQWFTVTNSCINSKADRCKRNGIKSAVSLFCTAAQLNEACILPWILLQCIGVW